MKDEFQYKSTPDGKPPLGKKRKGTFRDVTLYGVDPKEVDAIDCECIERDISRWDWAMELIGTDGDEKKFYDTFSKTNHFTNIVESIGERNGWDQEDENLTEDHAPEL